MMKILHRLNALHDLRHPVLLAAGFFDGVHRGHQNVIRRAIAASRQSMGAIWVLTFDPHPRKVLSPASAPALLTSMPHKLRLLASLGVKGCVIIPFTASYARQSPETFMAALMRSVPAMTHIFIGRNWTFGRNGQGNASLLKILAAHYGFNVVTIPPVCWRGKPISSTRIRRAVAAGRLMDAAHMLGRPFSLWGIVRGGHHIGRRLGIPTANLNPRNEIRPPRGVYIVMAVINGKRYPGVANLGSRPTAQRHRGRQVPILEIHLLDVCRNLYGKTMEVFFIKKIRAERQFASLQALKARIDHDIHIARRFFHR